MHGTITIRAERLEDGCECFVSSEFLGFGPLFGGLLLEEEDGGEFLDGALVLVQGGVEFGETKMRKGMVLAGADGASVACFGSDESAGGPLLVPRANMASSPPGKFFASE